MGTANSTTYIRSTVFVLNNFIKAGVYADNSCIKIPYDPSANAKIYIHNNIFSSQTENAGQYGIYLPAFSAEKIIGNNLFLPSLQNIAYKSTPQQLIFVNNSSDLDLFNTQTNVSSNIRDDQFTPAKLDANYRFITTDAPNFDVFNHAFHNNGINCMNPLLGWNLPDELTFDYLGSLRSPVDDTPIGWSIGPYEY